MTSTARTEMRNARLEEAVEEFVAERNTRAVCVKQLRGDRFELVASRNGDQPMPGASVLKVPTVLAALSTLSDDELDAPVSYEALGRSRYASISAAWPTALTYRQACVLALAASDNPASNAIVNRIGAAAVNAWCRQYGLELTTLSVGFRDDELGEPGRANITTADESALLMECCWNKRNHTRFGLVWSSLLENVRNQRLPRLLEGEHEYRVAHKTGTLSLVANDVGVICIPGTPILASAFCDGEDPDTAGSAIAALGLKLAIAVQR